jgi:O-methyltransferase
VVEIDPHSSSEFESALRSAGRFSRKLAPPMPGLGRAERTQLNGRVAKISRHVECAHDESEVLSFMYAVFGLPKTVEGCMVECGSFKGGSTAKFSIVAKMTGRELVVFDSFEGLPENREEHTDSILGHSVEGWFAGGEFHGLLDEVKKNVTAYGEIDVCRFVQGYYENTMPDFHEPVAAVYVDVDLAESTRTCLKYMWPLLSPGGVLMSQDGDFPLVIDVYGDDKFWEEELGCARPEVDGLGTRKIISIVKPG